MVRDHRGETTTWWQGQQWDWPNGLDFDRRWEIRKVEIGIRIRIGIGKWTGSSL